MTETDPDTIDALESTLRNAVGKDNAITSGELAAEHFPDDGEANPKTRELVKEVLMRERGLPIVSCSSGYYIPRDRETIENELDSLRGRIAGIEDRMELLEANWHHWTAATDGGESQTRSWADMTEAERQQVRDDPLLSPSDFGGGNDA